MSCEALGRQKHARSQRMTPFVCTLSKPFATRIAIVRPYLALSVTISHPLWSTCRALCPATSPWWVPETALTPCMFLAKVVCFLCVIALGPVVLVRSCPCNLVKLIVDKHPRNVGTNLLGWNDLCLFSIIVLASWA